MIAERVAGTDGLGPPKFTLPSLQAMWQGDGSYLAQLVLKPLVAACKATPTAKAGNGTTVDLRPACAALAGYNGTGKLDARADGSSPNGTSQPLPPTSGRCRST